MSILAVEAVPFVCQRNSTGGWSFAGAGSKFLWIEWWLVFGKTHLEDDIYVCTYMYVCISLCVYVYFYCVYFVYWSSLNRFHAEADTAVHLVFPLKPKRMNSLLAGASAISFIAGWSTRSLLSSGDSSYPPCPACSTICGSLTCPTVHCGPSSFDFSGLLIILGLGSLIIAVILGGSLLWKGSGSVKPVDKSSPVDGRRTSFGPATSWRPLAGWSSVGLLRRPHRATMACKTSSVMHHWGRMDHLDSGWGHLRRANQFRKPRLFSMAPHGSQQCYPCWHQSCPSLWISSFPRSSCFGSADSRRSTPRRSGTCSARPSWRCSRGRRWPCRADCSTCGWPKPGAAVAVPNVAGNPAPQGGVPAAGGLAGLVQALGPNQGQNGGSDARTLPISRDVEGMRFKEFREAATISQPVPFEDWPIAGPRTVKHVLSAMLDSGGSALAHHQAWRTACRFQPTDGPAMEHESWCRVLHVMATYDQLDTTNLASAELIARAIQRIEEKHKMKLAAVDDAGESAFFMGAAGGSRVGSVVSPKLTEWVGSEMHKEAAVAKERRKAREERTLARKGDKKEDK